MTILGWLALAAAVWLVVLPTAAPSRAERLVAARRLGEPAHRDPRGIPGVLLTAWANRAWPGGRVLATIVVAVAVGCAVVWGAAASVALGAVASCAAMLLRDRSAVRSNDRCARDLDTALQVIVGELDAGAQAYASLAAAASTAPSYAGVFARAARAAERGDTAAPALREDAATYTLGVAWQVGYDSGAALADVLRRVLADRYAREDRRRAVQVALAGPRSSAALLTGLPLLGVGLGLAMGAQPLTFLLGSPTGRLVGCLGVVLDVAGVFWMRRILRTARGA